MIISGSLDDAQVLHALQTAPQVMVRAVDRAVGKAALTLTRAIKDKISENGSMGNSHLINSIHADKPAMLLRDVRSGMRYMKDVEEGTKPGYMPGSKYALAAWIRSKEGGVSAKDAVRRAYGLALHIKAHGTKAHPAFEPAFKENESRLIEIIREGTARGVREIGKGF